jgi:cold shock CspA family protein
MAGRVRGVITKWVPDRGFGFADIGETGDVFVHVSDMVASFNPPKVGDAVEFSLEQTGRGPRARNITVLT